MKRRLLAAVMLALAAGPACATKRLPPGTPPPEYETHPLPAWPPLASASGSAPAPAAPSDTAPPAVPEGQNQAAAPPGTSPDAGRE